MEDQKSDPKPVVLSVRFYRLLVWAYPASFREQYGGWMVQAFRDSCIQARRQGGMASLLLLWTHTILDITLSVIEQYGNRGADMTKSRWIKLSGWLLAASSLFLLIGFIASSRPEYHEANAANWPIDKYLNVAGGPLVVIGLLGTAAGILGLLFRFANKTSRLGQAGLIISMIGAVTAAASFILGFIVQNDGPWWFVIMLGTSALFIGMGLFGVNCVQSRLFSRWNSLPLLISIPWPLFVLGMLLLNGAVGITFELPELLNTIFILFSLGGIGLVGYLLQSEANPPHSTPI